MTTEGPAGTPPPREASRAWVRLPATGAFSRLTTGQCERLHEATLRVLERTGLLVEEPEALELLRRAGAEVDGARVRFGARVWRRDGAPCCTTWSTRRASSTPSPTTTSSCRCSRPAT